MKILRVIDELGNKTDYETDWVPRIGERMVLVSGHNTELVTDHYYRVKDVVYFLNNRSEGQAAVLVTEESNPSLARIIAFGPAKTREIRGSQEWGA